MNEIKNVNYAAQEIIKFLSANDLLKSNPTLDIQEKIENIIYNSTLCTINLSTNLSTVSDAKTIYIR